MNVLKTVREWTKGNKTYFVCGLAIAGATVAWLAGEISFGDWVKTVAAALGGITIRAGITSEAEKTRKDFASR